MLTIHVTYVIPYTISANKLETNIAHLAIVQYNNKHKRCSVHEHKLEIQTCMQQPFAYSIKCHYVYFI